MEPIKVQEKTAVVNKSTENRIVEKVELIKAKADEQLKSKPFAKIEFDKAEPTKVEPTKVEPL